MMPLLSSTLLFVFLLPIPSIARPFVLVLSQDDLKDYPSQSDREDSHHDTTDSQDWEDFVDSGSSLDNKLDPGSWRFIFEPDIISDDLSFGDDSIYYSGLRKMIRAASSGEIRGMEEAVLDIDEVANTGYAPAQSVLAFLYQMGQVKERSGAKAFMHHHFASEGGCLQSKLALAYTYYRQDMHEKAVRLYSELAEVAVNSFLISKDPPGVEPLRIHTGAEENKDDLRKFRGEEGEEFQILEYQAEKGNSGAMHKIGILYYFGLSGLRCDHLKALSWFLKASEKGNPGSMELLGEMFARGAGVQRNYTKAFEWFSLASKHHLYSAYNGMGYLHIKGYGVEKNHTKAKEYFEKAAEGEDPGGNYNLGVMHMKGIGVKKDVKLAWKYFIVAANVGQPKAFYQLAKMFHIGVGLKKNLPMAISLYKLVAERGPWSFLSRWALESYIEGDLGKALLLYSRMAEMGYEVAQSNAAWILDKYGEQSMCIGESGLCTEAERHQRAHSLWWMASEQGNEHAALLIGDTYYYGRGTEKDYERAAEAYLHAKSQSNAQAMFNLGYMHEHGQGLPFDVHMAKRYYDEALQIDPDAKLPVTLALFSLWIRRNCANGFLVTIMDTMPHVYPKLQEWIDDVLLEEGNATIVTLFVCLATVLFLRERQRRHAIVPNEMVH